MGLLSEDFYNEMGSRPTGTPTVTPAAPSRFQQIQQNQGMTPLEHFEQNDNSAEGVRVVGNLTPEQQTAKFGGEVGSDNYIDYQAKRSTLSRLPKELMSTFGLRLPEDEQWDQMSGVDKAATTGKATIFMLGRTLFGLPKAIAAGIGSAGATAFKPYYNMFTGKPFDTASLAKEEKLSIPGVGEIPTMYQTQADAEASGMGPIASHVFAGSKMILDTLSLGPVASALKNTFTPRGVLTKPNTIRNTLPIKTAIDENTGVVTTKNASISEYYTMPKTEAKQFGGRPNTVQWKFTPVSDGAVELSVVKRVPGKQPGDFVKTEYGLKKVEEGDFGPEIKIYSTEAKSTEPLFARGVDDAAAQGAKDPIFLLPKERATLSKRKVTDDQIKNLYQISDLKGIEPGIRDAVVRMITGKKSVGELTEGEYVRAAQSLAKWGEKYGAPDGNMGPTGYTRSVLSPQRHYFDYVEDTYGVPLKTQVYEPFETAQRLTKVLDDRLQPELTDIFGPYAKSKFVEERRLVDAYLRGDKAAIDGNSSLTLQTKTELKAIADKLQKWDDQYGEILGVGREAYLDMYGGPKIANLGGTVPMYKDLDKIPTKDFFAKFKRKGSLDPFIDDPLASRQIYIKEGAKSMHYGPALENFKKLHKELPPQFQKHANSYVQEKLGRLGPVEKFVDSFVPAVNKKFGLNLPADFSRQMINYGLSSMYSGLVGTPKAIFQQTFQLPLFVYSRLGTKYAGEAFVKSFNKAERDRIAKGGWLNDVSLPYGSELTKEFTPAGRVGNAFKVGTQATLKPLTVIDNDVRIKTFLQAEMQWNDALNKFNSGQLRWNELETVLDFRAFSKADRNLIRQKLLKGDMDGAFDTYMREVLDETSFPYRTGSGARAGYGLTGKLGTGLLNYTIESTNVLARWASTGQWDKLIRFAGNAHILNNTLQETFDVNFGDAIFQKPYGVVSPALSLVGDFYSMVKGLVDQNREVVNENKENIIRTLKASMPAGIVQRNIKNFRKSIAAGADSNGMYPIYDEKGRMIANGDFSELFWGTLMGFPTNDKVAERDLYRDIKNASFDISQVRSQLDQLLREGKFDEMQKLIEETGVTPSQSAMQSHYIPRVQRTLQSAPAQVQAQFYPGIVNQE